MRNKQLQQKILKSTAIFALSTSFILSPLGHVSHVTKAAGYSKAEDILASLTPEQKEALTKLSTTEQTGLQVSQDVDLTSAKKTNVIVEFANRPAKVAQIVANADGQTLSAAEATDLVNQDHATFEGDLPEVLTDENNKAADYQIHRSYKTAFNGVAMSLPANQVKNLLKSKAVKTVWSDETFTVEPPAVADDNNALKADESNVANYSPYDGLDKLHAEGLTGKGIKIGILDTGMDYNHPDLKGAYKGGYDFVDNDNDPMETTYADWIKAGKPGTADGADYYTEHGTHVAGIIGGRGVSNSEFKTVGAAPEADLYAYRVLGPGGSGQTAGILAALDKSVSDGMDVINLSLGAKINNPLYATSVAVNNAVLSGVTAVVAAGNDGNGMYTLGAPGASAFALTVGASSTAIDLYKYSGVNNGANYSMVELERNYTDDIPGLKGKSFQLVDVGLAATTDFTGKDVKGKIAFIQRGTVALADKIKNAKAAGAVGVIMANNDVNKSEGVIQSYLGISLDAVPSFTVTYEDGLAISAALKAGKTDFTFGDFSKVKTGADELATFSSRGPSRLNYDIKPEVTAPGVAVMSTVPYFVTNPTVNGTKPVDYSTAYERLSGTSMATPYVAGVSALLLQSNKDLQPADIKSILMNTADPLSKDYSVFEVGAGRVDAYEAIHSNVELQVNDKTPTIINGKQKTLPELTGGISFGSFGFDGSDISDSRKITLKNRSEKSKTFDVKVNFQTGRRGSKDAALNNVTLTGPTSVKLNGISQKSVNFGLNIPKTAERGTYEGYIVFTNAANPTETYQIPFGTRVVDEGIDSFKAIQPMYSTKTGAYIYPFVDFTFSLKSYMKDMMEVVLQDPDTGEDLGVVGAMDPSNMAENTQYYIQYGFRGIYYPFTGDSKNPINRHFVKAKPGHYKLRLIATSESGKTFSAAQDIVYDVAPPNMTSNFDTLDKKVIEYSDSQLNSNGEFLYDFNVNVNDPEVEKAKSYGIPVDQSKNAVVMMYNGQPFNPVATDSNGDFKETVATNATPFMKFGFYGLDAAMNMTTNTNVAFAKNTTPYYYLKADKKLVKSGETINYAVSSNNIKNLKTSTFSFVLGNDTYALNNVKLNDAIKQYGDASVTMTTAPNGDTATAYKITFTYSGTQSLPEDLQLFKFDVKVLNSYFNFQTGINPTITTTDQSNVFTRNAYNYVENIPYQSTVSELKTQMYLEGNLDAKGSPISSVDKSAIGAKVTITSYDGKTVIQAPIAKTGLVDVNGIKADPKPYELKVDVPGYFTMYDSIVLSDDRRGEMYGSYTNFLQNTAAAGDTNKDNVIDVLDALYVQTYWGTNNPNADFNFDKVVDAKDMSYVVNNFGLTNATVKDAPKPKKTYKGATLDSILTQLSLN
ncbi:S8 family serine peptidase [Gottfriedia sp. NPDC057991]|uniref:S8 family serine peptidase n=1 Tax=Gottfriedia sp. NPDC057991 TaxID=3346298 RepID=UPI0036DA20A6